MSHQQSIYKGSWVLLLPQGKFRVSFIPYMQVESSGMWFWFCKMCPFSFLSNDLIVFLAHLEVKMERLNNLNILNIFVFISRKSLNPPRHVSSVQSLSRVWLFATPWTAARQASLSFVRVLFSNPACVSALHFQHLKLKIAFHWDSVGFRELSLSLLFLSQRIKQHLLRALTSSWITEKQWGSGTWVYFICYFFSFIEILLTNNTLCKFKVHSVMVWYIDILWNDYHNKVS